MRLPTSDELLLWVPFYLAVALFASPGLYLMYRQWQEFTLPKRLKTFKQMRRAFVAGGIETDVVDRRRDSAMFAMREFAKQSADPTQREKIATLMRNGIARVMHKADNRTANNVWRMLETLAAAAPTWEAEFLETVARSKVEGWSRGAAIRRLASLRGVASLDLLLALTDDPVVAHETASAIASIGTAAATPDVVARLNRMLGETQNGWAPAMAARALIAIGHATDPNLTKHSDSFDVWTRFAVRVKAAGIDALALTERLFDAGIVGEDRRTMMKPDMLADIQKAIDAGDGFRAVVDFLERVRSVYGFDTEWNPVPAYDAILAELSEVSSPRLPISDTVVREDGGEVSCRVAGHPARFSPKFMGDWTDLEAMLGGLNNALAQAGHSGRFANLHSGGQDAYVIVGTADGLAALVETIGLPLDADANVTVAIGIAAEDHTAALIQAEHPGAQITRGYHFSSGIKPSPEQLPPMPLWERVALVVILPMGGFAASELIGTILRGTPYTISGGSGTVSLANAPLEFTFFVAVWVGATWLFLWVPIYDLVRRWRALRQARKELP